MNSCKTKVISTDENGFSYEETIAQYNERERLLAEANKETTLQNNIDSIRQDNVKDVILTTIFDNITKISSKGLKDESVRKLAESDEDFRDTVEMLRKSNLNIKNKVINKARFLFNTATTYTKVGEYYEKRVNQVLSLVDSGQLDTAIAFEEISQMSAFYDNMAKLANTIEKDLLALGLSPNESIFSEFKHIDTINENINIKRRKFNIKHYIETLFENIDEENVEAAFKNFIKSTKFQLERAEKYGRKLEVKRTKELLERLQSIKPSKENLEAIFNGERDDMNKMDFWFNALLRSSDTVVSSFRLKLTNLVARVKAKSVMKSPAFTKAFEDYVEATGETRGNLKNLYEGIHTQYKTYKYNFATKEIEAVDAVRINIWWDESAYSLAIATWQKEIEALEEGSETKQKKRREYWDWLAQNVQQAYTDEVTKAYDEMSEEAKTVLQNANEEVSFARMTLDEYYSIENEAAYSSAIHIQQNLRYENDIDGNKKSPNELKIAKEINEFYLKRKEFYIPISEDELEDATKEAQRKKDKDFSKLEILISKMQQRGDTQEKINSVVKLWKKKNERRVVDKTYKERVQTINDRLSEIQKEFFNPGEKETINELWDKIRNTVRKYRDDNGKIQGEYLTEGEINNIVAWRQEIDSLKMEAVGVSGMSINDKRNFSFLIDTYNIPKFNKETDKYYANYISKVVDLIKAKGSIEEAKFAEYYKKEHQKANENKKNANLSMTEEEIAYYKALKEERNSLYTELETLQSKETTENYTNEYQRQLDLFIAREREKTGATGIITEEVKSFYNTQFKELSPWYKTNHTKVQKYNKEISRWQEVTEPIYIWQEILPRDKAMIKTFPAYHYYERKFKPEYVNDKQEMNPFDNEKALPKRGGIFDKKDEFFKKENENKPKQKLWKFYFDTYVEAQKDIEANLRPGTRLPAFEKEGIDRISESGVKHILGGIRRQFGKTELDTDEGIGLKEKDFKKMFDVIPVLHTGVVDIENFNFDLLGGLQRFVHGVDMRKEFVNVLSYSKGLMEALGEDETTLSNQERGLFAQFNLFNSSKALNVNKNIRLDAIVETIKTVLFNEYKKEERMGALDIQKTVGNMNKFSAINTLTWNIPSAFVNALSGRTQVMIEASAGRLFNYPDYLKGQAEYAKRVSTYINDGMKLDFGRFSPESKMLMTWGVMPGGFEEKLGKGFSKTKLKNFISSGFYGSYLRESTEHHLYVTVWLTALKKKHVDVNGKTMSLLDLYEKLAKEHNIYRIEDLYAKPEVAKKFVITKIKEGTPWDQKDEDRFRNNIQGVNADLFGEFDRINKSVFEKTALGTATYFFRRHAVRMIANRLAGAYTPRYNITTGRLSQGFYITAWHQIIKPLFYFQFDVISTTIREAATGARDLSEEEVQNVRRAFAELSAILILALLIMALGGDDDEDMKDKSFMTLYMLYFSKKVKSETEQFVPIPFLGFNEIINTAKNPSIGFSQLASYNRIFNDVRYIMTGDEKAEMRADRGFWEKGDSKLLRDALKLTTGFTGNTWHPEVLNTSFDYAQNPR